MSLDCMMGVCLPRLSSSGCSSMYGMYPWLRFIFLLGTLLRMDWGSPSQRWIEAWPMQLLLRTTYDFWRGCSTKPRFARLCNLFVGSLQSSLTLLRSQVILGYFLIRPIGLNLLRSWDQKAVLSLSCSFLSILVLPCRYSSSSQLVISRLLLNFQKDSNSSNLSSKLMICEFTPLPFTWNLPACDFRLVLCMAYLIFWLPSGIYVLFYYCCLTGLSLPPTIDSSELWEVWVRFLLLSSLILVVLLTSVRYCDTLTEGTEARLPFFSCCVFSQFLQYSCTLFSKFLNSSVLILSSIFSESSVEYRTTWKANFFCPSIAPYLMNESLMILALTFCAARHRVFSSSPPIPGLKVSIDIAIRQQTNPRSIYF